MSIDSLLQQAIDPDSVRLSGRYTLPHTWGVYDIVRGDLSGKRFRKGNHPVRRIELESEFGSVTTVALFDQETLAIELAAALNHG